jgi:hypothetical protein
VGLRKKEPLIIEVCGQKIKTEGDGQLAQKFLSKIAYALSGEFFSFKSQLLQHSL